MTAKSNVAQSQLKLAPNKKHEQVTSRNRALLTCAAESVQSMDKEALLTIQSVLQHGSDFGRWVTPLKWTPGGGRTAISDVNLRGRIAHFLPPAQRQMVEAADEAVFHFNKRASDEAATVLSQSVLQVERVMNGAVLAATRYLVLLRIGPVGLGRKGNGNSLDPSNIARLAYACIPTLLAAGAAKMLAEIPDVITPENIDHTGSSYFGLFDTEYLALLTKTQQESALSEAERMKMMADRGFWDDVPQLGKPLADITVVAEPPTSKASQRKTDPHLPLPDDYVSRMGQRSLWLIRNLAPNLLTLASHIKEIWDATDLPELATTGVQARRQKLLGTVLKEFVWKDSLGNAITTTPFPLRFSQLGKKSGRKQNATNAKRVSKPPAELQQEWPPRTFGDVMGLMYSVQGAHLFVLGLSTGARRSETLDLNRSCIQYAANGEAYANGRTFKLVQRYDGEERDWVLPDLAVEAVEQQVRLVTLVETIGPLLPVRMAEGEKPQERPSSDHLWAQLSASSGSDREARLANINICLRTMARTLGMEERPGGQSLRSHRFRKTVARLCALAMTQAPKVLMDVFGHKSIEMTLYYILTDRDLQVEVEQVSRELRVMRAKEVIEKMVDDEESNLNGLSVGGFGGPAALAAQRAISVQRDRLHRRGEDWGSNSAYELAEILTLQGKAWQGVREGVICTKFPGTESGPCNKSKGQPEPARCQPFCSHRLEEGFLRDDVDGSIKDAVEAYDEAEKCGEDLVRSLWAGQIRAHLSRFEDLRVKWMKNPVVITVLSAAQDGATSE